jgi:hypothetical protein
MDVAGVFAGIEGVEYEVVLFGKTTMASPTVLGGAGTKLRVTVAVTACGKGFTVKLTVVGSPGAIVDGPESVTATGGRVTVIDCVTLAPE